MGEGAGSSQNVTFRTGGRMPGEWESRSCSGRFGPSPQRRFLKLWESPRPRAHLALAGVTGVQRDQLRPQQALRAVTQGLCVDKNAIEAKRGARDVSPGDRTHPLYPQTHVPGPCLQEG